MLNSEVSGQSFYIRYLYTSMEIEEVAAQQRGGEDRAVATVRHMVKSVNTSENMTSSMFTLLPSDNRLTGTSHQNPGNQRGRSTDLEVDLASADVIISRWKSSKPTLFSKSSSPKLFQSSPKEVTEYLAAVDGLRHFMENLVVTHRTSAKLIRAQRLMEMSIARLEKEFHHILSANVEPTMALEDCNSSHGSSDDSSTDEDRSSRGRSWSRNSNSDEICAIDMMPFDAVHDLRSIAQRMVANGYGRECARIYVQTRKSVIEGCLNRIGVNRLRTRDLQKIEWGVLHIKIKNWICSVRIAVRILFASEKRLCDEIFPGLNNVRDSCFAEVVKGPTTKLLAFGESVAMSKNSSERLFLVLDMYETLLNIMPDIDIDIIYSQESCANVRTQASTVLDLLGESALGVLSVFENAIQGENSKTPAPGGTIHPMTGYVMNYLSFLSDYKDTLVYMTANATIDGHHDDELGRGASPLSAKLEWIIINLQRNLDLKSNLYKDAALSNLFLMNNLHYIVKQIKGSKLLGLLGYDWLRKNEREVRQYAENYERAAWIKFLNCLMDEGINVSGGISNGVSLQALEDIFRGFNCATEEVLGNHSGWIVSDVQLQEELRISIAEKMIPAYRSFLGRLKKYLECEKHSQIFIKYTHEDLEARLMDLFHGNPSSLSSGRP